MKTFLELNEITRKFGDFTAVDDVSLDVKEGEIFALLGPNGAGKTTCMKMITGTLQPTLGNAFINGNNSFTKRHLCMAETGYVPDDPTFPPYVRASEIISFQGEMHGLTKEETEECAKSLINRLEFADAIDEFAVNYSKGMKKKLAVVLALLHKPKLLVLDELTNGLDPYATRELHNIMIEQKKAGCAILFSTHLLDQAEKLCDRVAIIRNGKISIMGTLSELREESDNLEQLFFKHTGDITETTEDTSTIETE